jgi:hypothetical protein
MKIIRSYKEIHSKSFQNEEIFCEKSKTITYMQLQSREKFFLKVKKTFNRIIFFLKRTKLGEKLFTYPLVMHHDDRLVVVHLY